MKKTLSIFATGAGIASIVFLCTTKTPESFACAVMVSLLTYLSALFTKEIFTTPKK